MTVKKHINKVKIEADDSVQCIPITVFTFPNTTIQQQPACPLEEQLPGQGLDNGMCNYNGPKAFVLDA